jgi:hypothetical protein
MQLRNQVSDNVPTWISDFMCVRSQSNFSGEGICAMTRREMSGRDGSMQSTSPPLRPESILSIMTLYDALSNFTFFKEGKSSKGK